MVVVVAAVVAAILIVIVVVVVVAVLVLVAAAEVNAHFRIVLFSPPLFLGVVRRPLAMILAQHYWDAHARHMVTQMGVVCTTSKKRGHPFANLL